MSPVTSQSWKQRSRRDWLRWALIQLAIILITGGAVTVGLVLVLHQPIVATLVFCLSIATCCSMFTQLIRRSTEWLVKQGLGLQAEGWWYEAGTLLFGTVLGFEVGTALARWMTDINGPGMFQTDPRRALAMLFIAIVPGAAITTFFIGRARLEAARMEVQQAARIAAETRLRLLESQLEPHMLFNTLANLRVLIGMDPVRAQAMLDQLIAFLRATLQASRSGSHPLSAEFARLSDYLALMQVRMGSRLRPHFELPDELAAIDIPPLLLQPLVENAIKHGLEPHVEGGDLVISARREGQVLLLSVRDGGAGLSTPAAAPSVEGTGFGLQQVRERLTTRYGEAATLAIAPAEGGGTLVTLSIPMP
ncbi:histidine kinase [Pelomonas sp. SE-A7]|uniref:sensor histidine kinase n=1 Tax=Pelomonas sp. SE-A7 TaxID=3054953 RepID=UPI00259CF721|nr:histidine kinase [Pelomonas sp. SE-A7]MDM4765898.1 histidine kinase [Pelomonas sp. SE-A7]